MENEHWENKGADRDALRLAMRHFPTGVTVLTTGHGEGVEGMTANAILSVSLDPPLFLVSVHRESRIHPRIKEEGYFAASILADDQEGLARLFASSERSSGLSAMRSLGGGYGKTRAPLVAGALATIECELEAVYPGGDHDLFLGRLVAVRMGDTEKNPLVWHEGSYPTLNPAPKPQEADAFMDAARGFDARIRDAGGRRRKRR